MSYLDVPSPPPPPPPPSPPTAPADTPSHTSPVLITFTLVILICFFLGFCLVYFFKCCIVGILHGWQFQGAGSGNLVGDHSGEESPNHGLDQSLLRTFPTFTYSSVKEYRKEKCGQECAICLVEFEEESWLRLITTCYHAFHKECIDLWLLSHKTCPVCRRDLDSLPQKSPYHAHMSNNESFTEEDVRIDIKEGEGASERDNRGIEIHEQVSPRRQGGDLDKFSRSHSTGHSIVLIREGEEENGGGVGQEEEEEEAEDKYTLRLPEHVRIKLMNGHQYAKSCVTYEEMTKHGACGNCGFVEGVSASTSHRAFVKAI